MLLDSLYPPSCAGCRGRGWPFCPACWTDVVETSPPWCRRCGRPAGRFVESCPDCPGPEISWVRTGYAYRGPVRRAVMRLKFSGERSVVRALAPGVAKALAAAPAGPGPPPTLTWVPLGRRRRRRRGFDQSQVLARAAARASGYPVAGLLRRIRETEPQARRGRIERRAGPIGAFAARDAVPGYVVLVDDVFTTGRTAAACAVALLEAGCGRVGVVAAARSFDASYRVAEPS